MSERRDPSARVERVYGTGNPLFVMLLAATAKAMGLYVFRTARERTAPVHVTAGDVETLDRFDARVNELYRRLDVEVTQLAADFVAREIGVDVKSLMG